MSYRRSYYCLQLEMVLTRMVIAMPVITLFYYGIGMNQFLIGLSQAVFTAAVLLTDVPTGWIADRFSRKWANVVGDAMLTAGFVLYAMAPNFWWVVVCEIIVGIGMAFTNGTDLPQLEIYCREAGKDYYAAVSRVNILGPFAEMLAVIIGGMIGARHTRLALMVTAVPFAISTLLALVLADVGDRRRANGKHPLRDMLDIAVTTLHGQRELAWASMAAATQREVTHSLVWAFTPLLLLAGVPGWLLGVAWAINCLAVSAGAWMSKRWARGLSDHRSYGLVMLAAMVACAGLSFNASLATVWLYAIFGMVRGWASVTSGLLIQHHAPKDSQTTVHSVAGSLGRVMYLGLVAPINGVAGSVPSRAFLLNGALFGPLGWWTYRGLKRQTSPP